MVVCCPLIHWAGNERWENNCAGKSPIFISMDSQIVALSNSRIEEIIFDSEGENCPNSWALSLIFGFLWWPSFSTQLTKNYSTAICYSGVWQLWWKGPKVASQSSRPFQNCAVNHKIGIYERHLIALDLLKVQEGAWATLLLYLLWWHLVVKLLGSHCHHWRLSSGEWMSWLVIQIQMYNTIQM